MNCSTRTLATGPAYGFKLQTLDMCTEVKSSSDRSRSLLHYLVDIIQSSADKEEQENGKNGGSVASARIKPHLLQMPTSRSNHSLSGDAQALADSVKMPFDFERLLHASELATQVSLETCQLEVAEIERGMELARTELNLRNSSGLASAQATKALAAFIAQKGPEVSALKEELKRARDTYTECVEYFGENPKTMESSNQLFGTFVRFLKCFKQCQVDNLVAQKKKFEEELRQQIMERQQSKQAAALAAAAASKASESGGGAPSSLGSNGNGSSGFDSMNQNEMKVKEKRLLKQDEVYNGALEDILMGKYLCECLFRGY